MYRRNFGIMPRTFGGFFEDVISNGWNKVNEDVAAYQVPVNIKETDKSFEMQLVAPGIKKEEFKINVNKNILTISYDHKEENKEQQDGKWLRTEYSAKSFKRSFTLNENIDATNITAKYNDGMLHVTMMKKENAEQPSKEIVIN